MFSVVKWCCHVLICADVCLRLAGYDINISPWPLTVRSTSVGMFNVSLTSPPKPGRSVVVLIDTSDAQDLMSVSACMLSFSSLDWSIPKPVYVIPRTASRRSPSKRVCGGVRMRDREPQSSFSSSCCFCSFFVLRSNLRLCSRHQTTVRCYHWAQAAPEALQAILAVPRSRLVVT